MNNQDRLFITPVVSFNQDTETRQVKFDSEDVGTILIDKSSKRMKFRSTMLTIDGLYRIAEWITDKRLSKKIQVVNIRTKPSPMFSLFLKIIGTKDIHLEEFAEFLYRNNQVENLPF